MIRITLQQQSRRRPVIYTLLLPIHYFMIWFYDVARCYLERGSLVMRCQADTRRLCITRNHFKLRRMRVSRKTRSLFALSGDTWILAIKGHKTSTKLSIMFISFSLLSFSHSRSPHCKTRLCSLLFIVVQWNGWNEKWGVANGLRGEGVIDWGGGMSAGRIARSVVVSPRRTMDGRIVH